MVLQDFVLILVCSHKGLTFSNELISRDEGLHCDFACLLYSLLQQQLHWQKVHLIVHEAVEIKTQFFALGYQRKYNVGNPFDWMEFISLQGKANFFEKMVGDYQKALLCQICKMVPRISSSKWTKTSSSRSLCHTNLKLNLDIQKLYAMLFEMARVIYKWSTKNIYR